MLTLLGTLRSRALRVLWALEEMGLTYEFQSAPPQSAQAIAHNPLGKIPILLDGGVAITDSTAILTYLADKNAQLTFPAGTPERAIQDGHTHFLLDEFDACLWTASRHSFVLPEEHRVPEIKPSLKWEFERSQKQFVNRLGNNEFLMGDTLTIPDIIAAHCGGWAITAKFPIREPVFREYVDRLRDRLAFKRAMEH